VTVLLNDLWSEIIMSDECVYSFQVANRPSALTFFINQGGNE
jgi:hypothetical protein